MIYSLRLKAITYSIPLFVEKERERGIVFIAFLANRAAFSRGVVGYSPKGAFQEQKTWFAYYLYRV